MLASKRRSKLFAAIVGKAATPAEKISTSLVSMKLKNTKTRGKAVVIGPLEYCGNGIPFKLGGRARNVETNKGVL